MKIEVSKPDHYPAGIHIGESMEPKERLLKLLEARGPYTLADVHAVTQCLYDMGYEGRFGSGDLADRWIMRLNWRLEYWPTLYGVIQEERDPGCLSRPQAPASYWVACPEYELGERSTNLFEEMKAWLKTELEKEDK